MYVYLIITVKRLDQSVPITLAQRWFFDLFFGFFDFDFFVGTGFGLDWVGEGVGGEGEGVGRGY